MSKEYVYKPQGTCSKEMDFVISDDNKIESLNVIGGCNGNLKGIAALVKGQDIDEVINRLEGIQCGFKPTSCPDQIAQGLKSYKQSH